MSGTVSEADDPLHGINCLCDYCREIQKLAPKLARPGWVRLIGIPVDATPAATLAELQQTKKARLKAAKAKHKATVRLSRVLSGQFVRTRAAVAA